MAYPWDFSRTPGGTCTPGWEQLWQRTIDSPICALLDQIKPWDKSILSSSSNWVQRGRIVCSFELFVLSNLLFVVLVCWKHIERQRFGYLVKYIFNETWGTTKPKPEQTMMVNVLNNRCMDPHWKVNYNVRRLIGSLWVDIKVITIIE